MLTDGRKMSENVKPWKWNKSKLQAAILFAENSLTQEGIAAKVGKSCRQLHRWMARLEFRAKIDEVSKKIEDTIFRQGIAKKAARLAALDKRHRLMSQLIESRSADLSMSTVAGGSTGLLAHDVKSIGSGENAEKVHVYEFDAALVKEMREHEKQAAQEMGEWTEKKDVTSGGHPFKLYSGFNPDDV